MNSLKALDKNKLFKILKVREIENINIFIDLKNFLKYIHLENFSNALIESKNENDFSIVNSILYTVCYYKSFFNKINKNVKFYVFTDDTGYSFHEGIFKHYKKNRNVSRSRFSTNENQIIKNVRANNFNFLRYIFEFFKNAHFIKLSGMESDFIPFYLIKKYPENFNINNKNLNYIFSNDHDMFQILLTYRNTIQCYISNNIIFNLTCNDALRKKFENQNLDIKNFPIEYHDLINAFLGDPVDNIPGIKGIGPKTILKYFLNKEEKVKEIFGSKEEILENIDNNILYPEEKKDLFYNYFDFLKEKSFKKLYLYEDKKENEEFNKKFQEENSIEDIIIKSFKLQSFEYLVKWIEKKDNTYKLNLIKNIEENSIKKNIRNDYDKDEITNEIYKSPILNNFFKEQIDKNTFKLIFD